MKTIILSILFVLIIAAAPTAAHAVSATVTVNGVGSDGNPFSKSFNVPNGGDSVNSLDLTGVYGDQDCLDSVAASIETCGSIDCASSSGVCFVIDSGNTDFPSQAVFLSDANRVGQLLLSDLFVTNTSSNSSNFATMQIDYQHRDTLANPANIQCTGLSLSGFFSSAFGTGEGDAVGLKMNVIYTRNGRTVLNQPVDGTNSGLCAVPGASGTAPLCYTVASQGDSCPFFGLDTFYTPQNPNQVIQQLATCSNCDPGALVTKHFETTLASFDSNNFVGTPLGAVCQVPKPLRGGKPDFSKCVGAVGGLFNAEEARLDYKHGNCCNQGKTGSNGSSHGILLGTAHFNVASINIDPKTKLPLCTLGAELSAGVGPNHATFVDTNKDGFLDIDMLFADQGVGVTTDTKFVTIQCSATINGLPQTVTAADLANPNPL